MSGEDKERSPPTVISIHDFFPGCSQAEILLYKAIGLCIATLVGSLYYIVPLMFVALPFWVLYSKFALVPSIIFLGWMILSYWPISLTSGPPKSWFYKFLALYFDSELLLESSKEVYSKHTKPIVWMAFPHGVIAFSGSAYGYMYRARQVHTATADIVLRMPLIRHVFGVFNLTSGSRKSLETHLKKEREDVWIYPGGLAELFLSSPDKEEIFFEKRKGIVRLAMETGADITVTYLFGNSLVYSLLCSRQTAWVSRQMKISLTLFWGRFCSAIPHYTKLLGVTSKIITVPDFSSNPELITAAMVDEQHLRIKQEILRMYDTYKGLHPSYKSKPLNII